MLILENLLGLKSKQVEDTTAFLHATLEEDEKVYVEMPTGFKQHVGNCGQPQTPFDHCLFIGKTVIAICYFDDLIFWARNKEDIIELAIQLHAEGVELEQETMLLHSVKSTSSMILRPGFSI
ncbi:hypothetical protein ACHAXS_000447 [Conticribra weissflogii]